MGSLGTFLRYPDDVYPLLKMKRAIEKAEKQIPPEPHWGFCYSMLHKVSRSFSLVIQQLGTDLRNAVCVFYLVLRALDTVEDDTSIPTDEKLPILIAFHRHIYDTDWHYSCKSEESFNLFELSHPFGILLCDLQILINPTLGGTKEYKVLMDQFHHVAAAFLELEKGYQEAIEEITKRMGAGMAKFICQEVETVDDYDEYCHYVAGLVGLGLSKLFLASGSEVLLPDWEHISNSMGLFLQKTNIIRDYLEDINEIPKSRMFWPRKIWGKYADKLEDLKYEENSTKAVHCLNEMVTNALTHIEDCLNYMAALRDPSIFRFCAIPQIMAIGTLALCYNNVQVFRGVVKLRRGLTAKVIDRTKTMADVYGAFYDFSCMLKTKVDKNDPNASMTLNRLEAVQKVCRDTGVLQKRKSYINDKGQSYNVYGMNFTTDKLRSLVKKWQTLIEAHVDVKTTDSYTLRMFCIGFTKRRANQVKRTCYAQSSQVRQIRRKMSEIMVKEASSCDLKELVAKFIPEAIGKEIEKATQNIYPLQNVFIRKVKILKAPKFDLGKLMEVHGDYTAEDVGVRVDRPADETAEEPTEIIGA
ncbi:hypothetical protein IGI04_031257 [Brassica rapa subsp. trilocularis]|uniref:Squalene synthase n=1 Tax=Brassica rapa subsp. trilocularis TaxID=1813537 RepID=A0ABQ7LT29_BRACM|nr:hypothetical protein IGI04_031257 [Brassica rapa subsp. trilocularis]